MGIIKLLVLGSKMIIIIDTYTLCRVLIQKSHLVLLKTDSWQLNCYFLTFNYKEYILWKILILKTLLVIKKLKAF